MYYYGSGYGQAPVGGGYYPYGGTAYPITSGGGLWSIILVIFLLFVIIGCWGSWGRGWC